MELEKLDSHPRADAVYMIVSALRRELFFAKSLVSLSQAAN